MPYQLIFSDTAQNFVRIAAPDLKMDIKRKLDGLKERPGIGKALMWKLSGYYSLRNNKLRIIYRYTIERKVVEIHYIGHRRNLYEIVYKMSNGGFR